MRKDKGITLVALIITIIVMLILVAVSVNVLIKSDLMGIAEKTTDKYKTAAQEESKGGTIEINGKKYGSIEDYREDNEQYDPNVSCAFWLKKDRDIREKKLFRLQKYLMEIGRASCRERV